MAKTFIGIDVDDNILRVAALEDNGKELKPVALVQREITASGETAEKIAEILNEWDSANSRMAMTVPANLVLGRDLVFPFGDRRKILAAIPLELGSQLPIPLDRHVITALPAVADGDKFRTIGLALPKDEIESALNPFDDLQLPLRYLGVEPFVFAGQLSEQPENCLLLNIRAEVVSVLHIQNNNPGAYRIIARQKGQALPGIIDQVRREVLALLKTAGHGDLPILVFGPGLNEDLLEAVSSEFPTAGTPDESFEGDKLPAEFVPAVALARFAAAPEKSANLRQGAFAFRGSLAPFKKQLVAAAVLLAVSLTALIAGAGLSYSGKAAVANKLEQQMAQIYSQTISSSGEIPKDIPLHMTSRLNAARNQSQLFGGPGAAPLSILEALTRAMPEDSTNIIRELGYDENGIRLSGQAESFDAVDRLAAGLNREPLFSTARITDAKTNIDGKKVDFRIDLGFAGKGGQQ